MVRNFFEEGRSVRRGQDEGEITLRGVGRFGLIVNDGELLLVVGSLIAFASWRRKKS